MSADQLHDPAGRRRFHGDDGGDALRLRSDHGAAIVEFALILPFLAVMALGLIDYGNAYRQRGLVEDTVTTAARVNSQQATNRFADFESLRAVSSGLGGLSNATLSKVIVWKANTLITPQCTGIAATGTTVKGTSGLCNVYSAAQVNEPNAAVGFSGASTDTTCSSGNWDFNWCPLTRNDADGFGDYVGVYVEISYSSLTKVISSGKLTITQYAIYRLEPPYIGG